MTILNKVERSFRRALHSYDAEAIVQLEIAQDLARFLSESTADKKVFKSAFEIGCGTGLFTKQLLETFDLEYLEVNDLVAECEPLIYDCMERSINKNGKPSEWRFIEGDMNELVFDKTYDLVCSASCVQWVSDLPSFIDSLGKALNKEGYLAISSFGPDHFVQLQKVNEAVGNKVHELRYIDESGWHQLLKETFDAVLIEKKNITLWFDSLEQLLTHLRKTGVNANAGRQWSQAQLEQFEWHYQDQFAENGKLPLSFEPVFVIAKKTN